MCKWRDLHYYSRMMEMGWCTTLMVCKCSGQVDSHMCYIHLKTVSQWDGRRKVKVTVSDQWQGYIVVWTMWKLQWR